jgi:hypothetical protein
LALLALISGSCAPQAAGGTENAGGVPGAERGTDQASGARTKRVEGLCPNTLTEARALVLPLRVTWPGPPCGVEGAAESGGRAAEQSCSSSARPASQADRPALTYRKYDPAGTRVMNRTPVSIAETDGPYYHLHFSLKGDPAPIEQAFRSRFGNAACAETNPELAGRCRSEIGTKEKGALFRVQFDPARPSVHAAEAHGLQCFYRKK